jgi:hypothetical protein
MNMEKCPKHDAYAVHRATVIVCPKCGYIINSDGLLKLLKQLRIPQYLLDQIQSKINAINMRETW